MALLVVTRVCSAVMGVLSAKQRDIHSRRNLETEPAANVHSHSADPRAVGEKDSELSLLVLPPRADPCLLYSKLSFSSASTLALASPLALGSPLAAASSFAMRANSCKDVNQRGEG